MEVLILVITQLPYRLEKWKHNTFSVCICVRVCGGGWLWEEVPGIESSTSWLVVRHAYHSANEVVVHMYNYNVYMYVYIYIFIYYLIHILMYDVKHIREEQNKNII